MGWLEETWEDEEKRAWLLRWFWLISMGMLALGYVLILLRILPF